MSVDTKGLITAKLNINSEDIYDFIKSTYDDKALYDVKPTYDGIGGTTYCGHICFQDGEDSRQMFVMDGINTDDDKEYDFFEGHYIYLSLGYWGNSAKIISSIVSLYGGFMDENDCDDIYYVPIARSATFDYDMYTVRRRNIEKVLSNTLSTKEKIKIATEILSHGEELKKLL